MTRGKNAIIIFVVLIIGFGLGFGLRPVIAPPTIPPGDTATSFEARGVQYFEANVEEARQVVESCREGSVRGAECINAEEAIIKVEAEERRRRFLGQ